jgi:hypothetical protein
MDIPQIAATVAAFLVPYLPKLMESVAEATGETVIKGIPEGLKGFWKKAKSKPALEEAAKDLVKKSDDPDNLASFRKEIRKLLEENPELAAEVAKTLASPEFAGMQNTVQIANSTLTNSPVNQIRGSDNIVENKINEK